MRRQDQAAEAVGTSATLDAGPDIDEDGAMSNSFTPKRTPEEQAILDEVAKTNGREWTEKNAWLILEQARTIGELPDEDDADKPILFVLPTGVTAEEGAKLLKEFAVRHAGDGKAEQDRGEVVETRK